MGVVLPDTDVDPVDPLAELEGLCQSAGALVVGKILQRRNHIDPAHYIGSGKANEIAALAKAVEADTVVFDNDLSPAQIRDLEKIFECKVVDRSELILDIFAGRARTKEAKLQVELAQLEYTFPRLTRMWSHLERIGGGGGGAGIGTRGPGEQQLEIDRRIVRRKISALKRDIAEIVKRKEREVAARGREFTVGLVGYTNAGKSTLMNALTHAGTYVEDRLFATLDTKTRKWEVGPGSTVLLSDTVGFVRDLPHHLVASFKATLAEAMQADLLLHVVDASHPRCEQQMNAVEKVLEELGVSDHNTLMVFNKIDAVPAHGGLDGLRTLYPDALAVSALTGRGLGELTSAVLGKVRGKTIEVSVDGPLADGRLLARLHRHGKILDQRYDDDRFHLRMEIGEYDLDELQRTSTDLTVQPIDGALPEPAVI